MVKKYGINADEFEEEGSEEEGSDCSLNCTEKNQREMKGVVMNCLGDVLFLYVKIELCWFGDERNTVLIYFIV